MAEEDRVKQRQSEIELAAYFFKEFVKEVGKERALDVIERAWVAYGSESMGKRLEGVPEERRMEALGEWYKAQAASRPELKVVEASPKRVSIEIHFCPTWDACVNLGVPEMCQRYCDSDYPAAKTIHPKVKLVRDKEIANGATYCNHTWVLED
jgi:predicted ArsR family transcriptional regulator